MKNITATAFKRPTQAVRQRPYIFYRSVANYTLIPTIGGLGQTANIVTLQPQGNIADGNRVTHGWKIYVNYVLPTRFPFTIHVNGNNLNLGILNDPFLLIDTTLDPLGIDSTTYKIFNIDSENNGININMFVIEQILQISPM
jgi:hypothetical protein